METYVNMPPREINPINFKQQPYFTCVIYCLLFELYFNCVSTSHEFYVVWKINHGLSIA